MKKSHVVFVPFPGLSHLVSIIEFAKLLVNHDPRLSATILMIKPPSDPKVVAYTESLASFLPTRLHLTFFPTRQPSTSGHPSSSFGSLIEIHKPDVREAISKLHRHGDHLAGLVVDMFCTTMIDVAQEFKIPSFVFYISGASDLGFVLHIHDLIEQKLIDPTEPGFKDSGIVLEVPTFVSPVPAKVFHGLVLAKDWQSFFLNHVKGLKKAKAFIVNTFEEIQSHAIRSFSKSGIPIYPVGPILSPTAKGDDNLTKLGSDILEWLDHQPPSSVLFLCFGTNGSFERVDQVKEIARALVNSGIHFLWSLRKPPPNGCSRMESLGEYSNIELVEILPKGFLDRTAEIGRIVGWCPQTQILAHQAIGGFVSHCGWNSILESVYFGVPIATWPFTADQQMNAFELVNELEMAAEISLDFRTEPCVTEILSADRIEKGIKQVMEKDSQIRRKVKEMSEKSKKALVEGGSSYSYLNRFINDIINTE